MDENYRKRCLNYLHIHQLLQKAADRMHIIFRERWEKYRLLKHSPNVWTDNETSGNELMETKICDAAVPGIKEVLRFGNVETWDITLTNIAIQSVTEEIMALQYTKAFLRDDKILKSIKNIRNKIIHGKPDIEDNEFESYWLELSDALIKLGDNATEIDALKNSFLEKETPPPSMNGNPKTDYARLKKKAKKLYTAHRFNDAFEVYSEMLQLENISAENKAVIFVNRTEVCLKLSKIETAEKDAKEATRMWPKWGKSHFCLGQVYVIQKKFIEANEAFEKALEFNPNSQETKEEIEKILPQVNLLKGHHYRDLKNYAQAEYYYNQAADQDVMEAKYNLVVLMEDGKIPKDKPSSGKDLLELMDQDSSKKYESGVAEAQYLLGIMYCEGHFTPQNYKKAVWLFEKAISNGCVEAANTLGWLYKRGIGVEKSNIRAMYYFEIAKMRKSVKGLKNVAYGSLEEKDYDYGFRMLLLTTAGQEFRAENNEKDKENKVILPETLKKPQDIYADEEMLFIIKKSRLSKLRSDRVENEKLRFFNEKNMDIRLSFGKVSTTPSFDMLSLKPITIKDIMMTAKNTIYQSGILEGRIIDWSFLKSNIVTYLEDKNGDIIRLDVYVSPDILAKEINLKNEGQIKMGWNDIFKYGLQKFRPNCIITIINPMMLYDITAKEALIMINDFGYINFDLSHTNNRCHVCFTEAETKRCSNCLLSHYCSKRCQTIDWKEFNHKVVCENLKTYAHLIN